MNQTKPDQLDEHVLNGKRAAGSKAKSRLALFRPPNLFTVPGDPLVGALLAAQALNAPPAWNALVAVIGASLAFYASGLLANDFMDRAVDAVERPKRPIPAGAVNPVSVKWAALLLSLAGLLLTLPAGRPALGVGLLLTLAIWYYNAIGKKQPWLAPVSMGICRGLSLLLGASLMGVPGLMAPAVLLAAFFLTLYIALITITARHEAAPGRHPVPGWIRWSIPAVLSLWLACFLLPVPPDERFDWKRLSLLLGAMAILWAIVWTVQLAPTAAPRVVQASIAGLIRGLILTQAALCAAQAGIGEGFALLLLFLFPASGWIGKWFYGS